MNELVPRIIRTPAMITALHISLRDDVYRLLEALKAASARFRPARRASRKVEPAHLTETVEQIQFCSRAVQVFALMVVEAALNTYGLLRFDEPFERLVARAGPAKKVKILLKAVLRRSLTDSDEIVQVVSRLAHRRNALVHQRAELHVTDETGTFHTVTGGPLAPVDLEAAQLAVADMERFLELLPHYDPEATLLFRARLTHRQKRSPTRRAQSRSKEQ